MVSQRTGMPFAPHHIDRRVIPDRCLKASAQYPCASEVLKCVRVCISSAFTELFLLGCLTTLLTCMYFLHFDPKAVSSYLTHYSPLVLFPTRTPVCPDANSSTVQCQNATTYRVFIKNPSSPARPQSGNITSTTPHAVVNLTRTSSQPAKGTSELKPTTPPSPNGTAASKAAVNTTLKKGTPTQPISVPNTTTPTVNSTLKKGITTLRVSAPNTTTPAPREEYPKLLCVHFTGRLGNELFEYASTLGLALRLNRTGVFLGSAILSKVLKNFTISTANIDKGQLEARCQKAKHVGEKSCCKYTEEMTRLDPTSDYRVGMYLQSYRYFENQDAEIRKAVTFNDDIREKSTKIVRELRQKYNQSTLIGFHLRHGDMASDRNQKLGYPLASQSYINKSMIYFKELYPDSVFVVASDSVDWCKDNVPKKFTVHFLEGNSPAVDMLTLSSLNHTIISFGTFSWWIGYLNTGKTVYMKDFVIANTFIGKTFNPKGKDYIYPGWIPL